MPRSTDRKSDFHDSLPFELPNKEACKDAYYSRRYYTNRY